MMGYWCEKVTYVLRHQQMMQNTAEDIKSSRKSEPTGGRQVSK